MRYTICILLMVISYSLKIYESNNLFENNINLYLFENDIKSYLFSDNVNSYFFESEVVNVECKINFTPTEEMFKGNANAYINKLPNTKIGNYYEILLNDFDGKCTVHNDVNDEDCIFSDFDIGYFYVDKDKVYMMPHWKEYLTLFSELETFPPTNKQVDDWESKNPGCFFMYRFVCCEYGFGKTDKIISFGGLEYYNFIRVDEDLRYYNLYPENTGTYEYLYIIWKKDEGIIHFCNWSGNYKNFIEFYTSSFEGSPVDFMESEY